MSHRNPASLPGRADIVAASALGGGASRSGGGASRSGGGASRSGGVGARSGERFEVLDSLRGVCALIVVLYHYPVASHVSGLDFIRGGYMFVDFFFVLSGFVIAWSYAGRIAGAADLGRFLIRRFFRLWPLHLFVLALFLAVELAGRPAGAALGAESGRTLADFWRTLTLTNAVGLDHQSPWNMASWSISAEWWTYLAFGLIVLALPRALTPGLVALALGGLAVCVALHPSLRITSDHGLLRCFYGFGLGALLAVHWPRARARLAPLGARGLGLAEIGLVAATVVFVGATRLSSWSFLAPVLFTLVVAVFALEAGPVSRLLRHRALVHAGVLSYSIYMVHQFVMGRVRNVAGAVEARTGLALDPGNPWAMDLLTIAVVAAVCVAAHLTWRLVERPGQALGAALVRRWPAPARPAYPA